MNRSDLVQYLAEQWDRSEDESRYFIEECFESIIRVLEREERLELRGFGVFEIKDRDSRPGRIPGTGKTVNVPPHKTPDFSPGKALKQAVRKLNPEEDEHE